MLKHSQTPLVLKAKIKFSIPGISNSRVGQKLPSHSLDIAENATRNGGCGIYIRQPNKPPITIAIPSGTLCSNYRAEAQVLLTATETVTQLETRPKKVVLLTDSLSVLQSLASGNPEDYTLRNLNSLTSRTTAYFNGYLHIPAYMETKWPISWRKKEARSSSQNPNLVTKKQKGSSEARG